MGLLGGLLRWGLLSQPLCLPWRLMDAGAEGAGGGHGGHLSPHRAGMVLAMSCGSCPPQCDPPEKENVPKGESPVVLRRCSLTSSMCEEEDDGFMEILDEEEMKVRRRMDPAHGRGE